MVNDTPTARQVVAKVVIECDAEGNTRTTSEGNFPIPMLIAALETMKVQTIQRLLMQNQMAELGKQRIVPASASMPRFPGG